MLNKEIKQLIIVKSGLAENEAEKMYFRFFHNWAEHHKYIYKRFNINFGDKILDIGCGCGHNLIHFNKKSIGIEKDERFFNFAKKIGLNVKDLNVEDDLLNLKGENFEFIWCTDFLVHTVSPFKFLCECREILAPAGKILIQIPLMSVLNKHKSSCHLYAFNKKSLIYMLDVCGYKILKTSGCVRCLPGFINTIFEPVLRIFGTNIWVLAEKLPEPKFNKNKLFLPKWINYN